MLRLRFAMMLLTAASMTWGCHTDDPAEHRYRARGLVLELAGTGTERSVTIRHEAIPGFVGRDGKSAEMPSMKMTFGAASEVPSAVLEPGNKISFDFDVRWSRSPALWIVHAEPLSSSTTLELPDGTER